MPLKLSLRPGERFVVNGAVLQNGDRRGVLILQNMACVLREKDIMQPEEVTTPARRIYFPVMLMYLNQGNPEALQAEFNLRLKEFSEAITNADMLEECAGTSRDVLAGEFYKALIRIRRLIAYEDHLLGNVDVDSGLPARRHAG